MQFREAAKEKDDTALLKIMSNYGILHFFLRIFLRVVIANVSITGLILQAKK